MIHPSPSALRAAALGALVAAALGCDARRPSPTAASPRPAPALAPAAPAAPAPPAAPSAEALAPWSHRGARYRVIRARPHQLRAFWRDPDGAPYTHLARLWRVLAAHNDAPPPLALVNGGIFEPGLVPTGLYIEDHQPRTPLNLRDGRGNFFTKPNGVFAIDSAGAHITPSPSFAPNTPRLALQSGPLLVLAGRPAQRFSPDHPSRKTRNAVGVTPSGDVVLLVSDLAHPHAPLPNLHDLADALIALGCRDALYLDGSISCALDAAWRPPCAEQRPFATMLAVFPP